MLSPITKQVQKEKNLDNFNKDKPNPFDSLKKSIFLSGSGLGSTYRPGTPIPQAANLP